MSEKKPSVTRRRKKKKTLVTPPVTRIDAAFGVEECPWDFGPTQEELEAIRWLLNTLEMICERKRPNADKAALVRGLLGRWGDYATAMHRRIHELEEGDPGPIVVIKPDSEGIFN